MGHDDQMMLDLSAAIRNVGALLRLDQDRFLFQLRDDIPDIIMPGRWGLFGGHVDPGEDFEPAIRRELAEELNFTAREVRFATEMCYPVSAGGWAHRQFFEIPIPEADIAGMELREGCAMRVMAVAEYLAQSKIIPWEAHGLLWLVGGGR